MFIDWEMRLDADYKEVSVYPSYGVTDRLCIWFECGQRTTTYVSITFDRVVRQ